MAVRITSRKAGFRRCGVAHPAQPVTYPTGKFSDQELARLKAEPMLIVDELPDPDPAAGGGEGPGGDAGGGEAAGGGEDGGAQGGAKPKGPKGK
jgi:hypothetical protein